MSEPLNIDHVRALLDDELAALNKFVARGAGMLDADPADPECSVIVGLVRDAVEAHLDEDGVLEYVTMSLLKTALVLKERLEQTELKVIELEARCSSAIRQRDDAVQELEDNAPISHGQRDAALSDSWRPPS